MEFRQLEYFLAIVEHGGINGAAQALGVAQPTVSQALRSLERDVGIALFHRIGRGMVPTAAGRALVGPGRQVLRDVATAAEIAESPTDELRGRVDITANATLALPPVATLVARLRGAHPRVTVRFGRTPEDEDPTTALHEGRSEFVLADLPLDDTESGFATVALADHEYWLSYPPGVEVPPGPLSPDDMPDVPLVLLPLGNSLGDEISANIRRAGVRPRNAVLVDHRETRIPMMLAGIGGTVTERTVAEALGERAVSRPIDPPARRTYGLVFDPRTLSPAGEALVAIARALGRAESPAGPPTGPGRA